MTKFSRLEIENWRQFASVKMDLHPRLTVITGANGAGKSTLIRIFSQHLGFSRPLFGLPVKGKNGVITYLSGFFLRSGRRLFRRDSDHDQNQQREVGLLRYANDVTAPLTIADIAGAQFHININNQQTVSGTHIDSHQPISSYQQVSNIPINPMTPEAAYHQYSSEVMQAYNGGRSQYSPMYRLKESLISLAVFGQGNSEVDANPELYRFYMQFQEVLRNILPDSLGFLKLRIQPPDVILVTESGDFVIDAVSGGILSLIDFGWRIFSFSQMHPEFVVTIDEPENHLHPSLQRDLMPSLIRAFPNTQFIIATHSPFMVTAVKDSFVYALRYVDFEDDSSGSHSSAVEQRRVESIRLDAIKRAGTANEVLREVLGMTATMPTWAHDELDMILSRFQNQELTRESVAELRAEIEARGFEELYPEALSRLAGVPLDKA